jgi:2-oxo-hept-3-ene-1,7-dioate hydratase
LVTGPARPYDNRDLDDVHLKLTRNHELVGDSVSRDVIDSHLPAIAWLATLLGRHGMALEAGQVVITGSFNRPIAVEQGEDWMAMFEQIGTVSARFV